MYLSSKYKELLNKLNLFGETIIYEMPTENEACLLFAEFDEYFQMLGFFDDSENQIFYKHINDLY